MLRGVGDHDGGDAVSDGLPGRAGGPAIPRQLRADLGGWGTRPPNRRRELLERDLRAALDMPEATAPGVVDYLLDELAEDASRTRRASAIVTSRNQRAGF